MSEAAPAVAIAGTFDVRNYGDLLFPLIAAWRLEPLGLAVEAISPTGVDTGWNDAVTSMGLHQLAASPGHHAAYLIGGGNIVHLGQAHLRDYPGEIGEWAYPALWLGISLLATIGLRPIVWNAPGVAGAIDPEAARLIVPRALVAADYIAVRDESSRVALDGDGTAGVEVVPDTVADIARMWPRESLTAPFSDLLARKAWATDRRFFAVHVKLRALAPGEEEAVAATLDEHAAATGATPLLLALGECHDDQVAIRRVARHLRRPALVVDDALGLREIAAAIAWSEHYAGCSLHGYITAAAYGRPARIVARPRLAKQAGFLEHVGRPGDLAEGWREALGELRAPEPASGLPAPLFDALDRHWARVADAVQFGSTRHGEDRARYLRTVAMRALVKGGWSGLLTALR